MNRIDSLFAKKKKEVLAVYFTAGFPKLNDTLPVLEALQEAGADLVEIGMPFSDPLADGPVIQESSRVALENGMSISLLFRQLKNFRQKISLPVVLMGYVNPVLQFGVKKFVEECAAAGIDGVILPDLPPEIYEREFRTIFEQSHLHFIFLVTPRTPENRRAQIAKLSKGFLYLVSAASTTGADKNFSPAQQEALKKATGRGFEIPVLTGFGIHDHETFRAASAHTNGAVVGSAFIRALAEAKDIRSGAAHFIQRIKTKHHDHPVA